MPVLMEIRDAEIVRRSRRGEPAFRFRLDDLSLGAGERIGIVGPSGCGKSTLLDFVALLTWPASLRRMRIRDGGGLEEEGRGRTSRKEATRREGTGQRATGQHEGGGPLIDLTAALNARRTDILTDIRARFIGYIVQSGALLPYLSVGANALLAAKLAGGAKATAHRRLDAYSHRLGIHRLLDRYPAHLSGGERQRSAVLRTLMTGARVLVADEPTAALDHGTSREVMATFVEVAEETGAAVLCASHDLALLADHGFQLRHVANHDDASGGERLGALTAERGSA